MLTEKDLRNAIIDAGLTFSPEAGEDYPMRTKPLGDVIYAIRKYLNSEGIVVAPSTGEAFGRGLLKYYSARADLAHNAGDYAKERQYRRIAMQLPMEDLV